MTQAELTKLSPFLTQHFGEDYAEHVKAAVAHNNYHCAQNILLNADKFPKANFAYCEKQVEEIPLYWPEVIFQKSSFRSPHNDCQSRIVVS